MHWASALLFLCVMTGCTVTRVVRQETGWGYSIVLTPRTGEKAPVQLEKGEFRDALARLTREARPPENPQQAARQLFEVEARSGSYVYFVLWTVPEPVTKGIAAVMTATLIVYLGVDTFWGLVMGFRQLVAEADMATTFDELRKAGERYGRVMGRNAARAFALLATVALGNTAAGFASVVPKLPGSAQAALQARNQAGISSAGVGEVQAVTVSGEAITLVLAPGAVAMTGSSAGGAAAGPIGLQGYDHHIATDKWWSATHNGGPWSPQFQKIFDKAGMSLNDPANIVRVNGHQGPHPQEYHREVFRRLFAATGDVGARHNAVMR